MTTLRSPAPRLLESSHANYGSGTKSVQVEPKPISPSSTPLQKFLSRNKGLMIIFVSRFFFSLMDSSVKYLATLDESVSSLEVIAARMGITYVLGQIYMLAAGIPDPFLGPEGIRGLLVFRGVTGFLGLFGLYYSLQYMTLSEATVLTFLTPMVTTVFGFIFLREAVSLKQWMAGFISLSGVVLIAKPPFLFGGGTEVEVGIGADEAALTEAQRLIAVGAALIGVVGNSCTWVSMRTVGQRAHTMHNMSHFSLWCVVVSIVAMYATGTKWVIPIDNAAWVGVFALVGFFGFMGQLLLIIGLQFESASRGSMAVYIQIVFSLILERILFGVSPSGSSLVGTFVIVTSAIYVALNKPPVKLEPSDEEEGPISANESVAAAERESR